MQLLYFMGNNFGDRLNPFIFNALFDAVDFAEKFPDHVVFGLGSILSRAYFSRVENRGKIVVFGSGVRQATIAPPTGFLPEFVRGPVSAKCMACDYIADTAYLLPFLKDYSPLRNCAKKKKLSLMPYFHHAETVNWERIAAETGVNIIMPGWPLQRVLKEIAESEHVLAGAMHGCIAADIFRIPWARLRFKIHEADFEAQIVKWIDWTESVSISDSPMYSLQTMNSPDQACNGKLEEELIAILNRKVATERFALSDDHVFDTVLAKLHDAVHAFSGRYGIGVNRYRTVNL